MAAEYLGSLTGTRMLHVPYKGAGPAAVDLMAGHVQMLITALPGVVGPTRDGKLRMLAQTGRQRSPAMPEIPTAIEAGLPDFVVTSPFGLLAPAGTPRAIVNRVRSAALAAMDDPVVARRLADLGADRVGNTPEEHEALARADAAPQELTRAFFVLLQADFQAGRCGLRGGQGGLLSVAPAQAMTETHSAMWWRDHPLLLGGRRRPAPAFLNMTYPCTPPPPLPCRLTDLQEACDSHGRPLPALPVAVLLLWGVAALQLGAGAAARGVLDRYCGGVDAAGGGGWGWGSARGRLASCLLLVTAFSLLPGGCAGGRSAAPAQRWAPPKGWRPPVGGPAGRTKPQG
jgi:hypothetical protein